MLKRDILIKVALTENYLRDAAEEAYSRFKSTGNPKKGMQYLKFMNAGGANAALLKRKKKAITIKVK